MRECNDNIKINISERRLYEYQFDELASLGLIPR
jgi:hypothetical protein